MDNTLDMPKAVRVSKNRKAARVLRKLSDSDIEELGAKRAKGATYAELMLGYGLAKSTLSYIVNHKTYAY